MTYVDRKISKEGNGKEGSEHRKENQETTSSCNVEKAEIGYKKGGTVTDSTPCMMSQTGHHQRQVPGGDFTAEHCQKRVAAMSLTRAETKVKQKHLVCFIADTLIEELIKRAKTKINLPS
jgi:hypothetical protein